jgi:hypothetical protein
VELVRKLLCVDKRIKKAGTEKQHAKRVSVITALKNTNHENHNSCLLLDEVEGGWRREKGKEEGEGRERKGEQGHQI